VHALWLRAGSRFYRTFRTVHPRWGFRWGLVIVGCAIAFGSGCGHAPGNKRNVPIGHRCRCVLTPQQTLHSYVDPQSSQSDESPHCHSALKELMRILLTAEQLAEGIDRLADAVRSERAVRPLTVVGVLTGSIVLVADLIRRLDGPVRLSMVWASSYRGTSTTAGRLEMRLDLLPDLTGQEVLLVDDIFDTGRTLEAIVDALGSRGAARVRSLVLLRKSGRAEVAIQPDFVGFDIPDVFVVGYGLDYNGSYRHLPHVASLDPSDIVAVHRVHESGGPQ